MASTEATGIKLNLSYVLHEPSTSSQVADYAHRIEAQQPRITSLVNRLAHLGDERLCSRIVTAPQTSDILDDMRSYEHPIAVHSLRLGAWRMLGRILNVTAGVETQVRLFDILAANQSSSGVIWFRSPSLVAPPPEDFCAPTAIFAVAIVRPGSETILLDAKRISMPAQELDASPSNRRRWPAQVLRATEDWVRSYVDQWSCDVPLWDAPAETALPEFQSDQSK